jgi:hypothetical protein
MIEETIVTAEGARPDEIRLFVFDGKVAAINTVFVEDGKIRNGAFHTPEWALLDWRFSRTVDREFERPLRLDDMIAVAERLGAGLDHVRVDIYDCGDRFWIGELTLYSWSGYSRFSPDEADLALGAHWKTPTLGWPAMIAGLFRDPGFRERGGAERATTGGERHFAVGEASP